MHAEHSLKTNPLSRFHLLDPVRGLAAIWVFVFHFHFSEHFQSTFPTLHSVFKIGDRAVPLFFVISGYCIAMTSYRVIQSNVSSWTFLKKRIYRIYPTFWCSIAVICSLRLLGVYLHSVGIIEDSAMKFYPELPKNYSSADWFGVFTLTQGFRFIDKGWCLGFGKINGAYWTLAIEMQFYLTVFLLLLFRKKFVLGLAIVSGLSFAIYYHSVWKLNASLLGLFFPFWTWFSFGLVLFWLHHKQWTPQILLGKSALPYCSYLLGLMAVVLVYCGRSGIAIDRQLFALLSTVSMWCLLALDEKFIQMRGSGHSALRVMSIIATALGTASYTIYLTHNELSHIHSLTVRTLQLQRDAWTDCVVVVGTIAMGYLLYHAIEKPFLRKRRTLGTQIAEKRDTIQMMDDSRTTPTLEQKAA